MAVLYTTSDLEEWNECIFTRAQSFGLETFPQEFDICDHEQIIGYTAYSGMPAHYPHWSYGKSFEKIKTLYNYGVAGLPYEMVINSDPCIAYLMRDNSLLLQILTIAHVYGHNDFFKKNFTFKFSQPGNTIGMFKVHADRVRDYIEAPSIGLEKVEQVLDAAHALSLQCRRNLAIRKLKSEEQRDQRVAESAPAPDPFQLIHRRQEYTEPDLKKVPLYPEEDLLLFVRDHNKYMDEWERDLLGIVHEETQYFTPQIETKIMNEGWASFWHKRILESLDLPQGMRVEFMVRHNQVLAPAPGAINPYHLGFKLWEDIERRYDRAYTGEFSEEDKETYHRNGWDLNRLPGMLGTKSGRDMLFFVRETDRDASFLRQYLTEDLVREMNLFEYRTQANNDRVVSRVADKENWRDIKETLIRNVGMGTVPVIKIEDIDYNHNGVLYLKHGHDGRDLLLEYAEHTLKHLHRLWRREVVLETVINEKKSLLCYEGERLVIKGLH